MRRDSAIKRWHEGGGRLAAGSDERRANAKLYPYFDTKVDSTLNYSSMIYALLLLVCMGFMIYFPIWLMKPRPPMVRSIHLTATAFYTTPTAEVIALVEETTATLLEKDVQALTSGVVKFEVLPTIPVQVLPDLPPTATPTPLPTSTPLPTPTATPVCARCNTTPVRVRLGYFYPPAGGSHCPAGGGCADLPLADGSAWFLEQGRVAACPDHFPLGASLEVPLVGVYRCAHRLPLARCDYATQVCDVLVLAADLVVPDWTHVYDAILWYR